jgi:TolB-like protein
MAVLPFENVGRDPDGEYLSDGIAESLSEFRADFIKTFGCFGEFQGEADPLL